MGSVQLGVTISSLAERGSEIGHKFLLMIWIPGDIIDHFSPLTATGLPTAPPPGDIYQPHYTTQGWESVNSSGQPSH